MFFLSGRIYEVTRTLGMPSITSIASSKPIAPYLYYKLYHRIVNTGKGPSRILPPIRTILTNEYSTSLIVIAQRISMLRILDFRCVGILKAEWGALGPQQKGTNLSPS